jgi:hypothetical protein
MCSQYPNKNVSLFFKSLRYTWSCLPICTHCQSCFQNTDFDYRTPLMAWFEQQAQSVLILSLLLTCCATLTQSCPSLGILVDDTNALEQSPFTTKNLYWVQAEGSKSQQEASLGWNPHLCDSVLTLKIIHCPGVSDLYLSLFNIFNTPLNSDPFWSWIVISGPCLWFWCLSVRSYSSLQRMGLRAHGYT